MGARWRRAGVAAFGHRQHTGDPPSQLRRLLDHAACCSFSIFCRTQALPRITSLPTRLRATAALRACFRRSDLEGRSSARRWVAGFGSVLERRARSVRARVRAMQRQLSGVHDPEGSFAETSRARAAITPTRAIGPRDRLLCRGVAAGRTRPTTTSEKGCTFPPAPTGGYFQSSEVIDLISGVLDAKVIWACTTCRACEEQCPVMISYVDKIVGLRRDQVMMKSEFPAELQKPFNGMETNGNPWNLSALDRANWAEGLDVPLATDRRDAELLYWVGCAACYDDRSRKIARSMVTLLRAAGIDFAILGPGGLHGRSGASRRQRYLFKCSRNDIRRSRLGATKPSYRVPCYNTLRAYPTFGGRIRSHPPFRPCSGSWPERSSFRRNP